MATCQSCGCGLCAPCSTRFTLLRCESCLLRGNAAAAQKAYGALFGTVALFAGLFWVFSHMHGSPSTVAHLAHEPQGTHGLRGTAIRHLAQGEQGAQGTTSRIAPLFFRIEMSVIFAFGYWGYKFLSDRMPRLILATGPVWLFYFLFKWFIGCFIGFVVGPYMIYKSFRDLYITNKTRGQIERREV